MEVSSTRSVVPDRSRRTFELRLSHVFLFILLSLSASRLEADSASICADLRCGFLKDGAYDHIVVGTFVRTVSDEEVKFLFSWAKGRGFWAGLPSSVQSYLQDVKLVQIAVPDGDSSLPVPVFMQREEWSPSSPVPGQLVRYAPHDEMHDTSPNDPDRFALFHGLTGCVASLCGPENKACFTGFRNGVFRADTGEQINLRTGKVIP